MSTEHVALLALSLSPVSLDFLFALPRSGSEDMSTRLADAEFPVQQSVSRGDAGR